MSKKYPLRKFTNTSRKRMEIFYTCKDIALKSQMRSKHCAALERNGKIILIDCNHYGGSKNSSSLHAEANIQKKLSRMSHKIKKRYNYNLYIVRYSKASGYMNSKPCSDCVKCIKSSMPYVSKVFYSYDNDSYICIDKKTLETNHVSTGNLYRMQNRKK
jgi:deoxycytidylate deaminase